MESPWYAYLFGVEYRILLLPLEGSLPGEEQMREQLLSVYNVTVPMHTDGTQEGFRPGVPASTAGRAFNRILL